MTEGYQSNRAGVRIHRRSHLDQQVRCPDRHRAEQQGQRGTANEQPLERGTGFHAVAEAALLDAQRRGLTRVDADFARRAVREHTTPETYSEVVALVDRWAGRMDLSGMIDAETLLSSRIIRADESPDGLEHRIGGRLDVILEPGIVWDFKTQYAVPALDDLMHDRQVCSYALMASDRYQWERVTVVMDYVRWDTQRWLDFDLEALKAVVRMLDRAIRDYLAWELEMRDAAEGERRPSRFCGGCPLLLSCDVAPPDIVGSWDQAAAAASTLLLRDAQTPVIRDQIKAWLVAHEGESLVVNGTEYYLGLEGPRDCPDVQAMAVRLEQFGIDPWTVVGVDMTKLGKVCDANPGLAEQLRVLIRDRRNTRLKSRAAQ
jgi:hypothetical protein